VGEHGTVWHALVLGLVTTLTHTWAVLVVAALAANTVVQSALALVSGLLVAGLGFWLLLRRLAGQADHVHLPGGHSHGHGQGHDHSHGHGYGQETARPGWWGVVLLGMAGGIVPCWDAVALLGVAVAAQRVALALPLLLAFSAGLAGVLVALGVAVVQARKVADLRWGESERFRRVVRALPLVSAALITVMGLWLCFSAPH
jgi:ABC-type nickel/cobalt efflux system permease component RcnA